MHEWLYNNIIIPKLQRRPILQLVSLHAHVLDDVCACQKMRWLWNIISSKIWKHCKVEMELKFLGLKMGLSTHNFKIELS